MARKVGHLRPALEAIGREMVSITQRRIHRGVPPPNAPLTRAVKQGKDPLRGTLKDDGYLLSSINYRVGLNKVAWGSDRPYARIQQFGGVVRAKGSKRLAIPASPETRTLMRRYGTTPRECIEGLKRAGWQVWIKGNAILGKRGKKGKIRTLFILKSSVRIPARPFLRFGFEEKRTVRQILEDHLGGR